MTSLEEAREDLLSKIELELCRIQEGGREASEKLSEFYDYIASQHISSPIFFWYKLNRGRIRICYSDGEVKLVKETADTEPSPDEPHTDELENLINRAFYDRS